MTARNVFRPLNNQAQQQPGRPVPDHLYRSRYEDLLQNYYDPQLEFAGSAAMPIPGLTAPVSPGAGQPVNTPAPTFATAFQPSGPYGLLAQQMAGLQTGGLLGPKQGFRIPGGK